jgi:type IV pilus assembly protein PilB
MGVEPFLIAYAINIIVAQRLIRKLCGVCKKKVTNLEEHLVGLGLDIKDWAGSEIYEAVGCDKCNGSGYKGRLAIHEALYFTKELKRIIVKSGEDVDEEAVRDQSRRDGTLNLREAGFEKVRLGYTSIQEVIGATMED